jgi:hypothetical protein
VTGWIVAVIALAGGLTSRVALREVRRAHALAAETIAAARAVLDDWRETERARVVYGDAFLSVVSSLLDENASDEERGEAIRRSIESVHDYVAVQQEHRKE